MGQKAVDSSLFAKLHLLRCSLQEELQCNEAKVTYGISEEALWKISTCRHGCFIIIRGLPSQQQIVSIMLCKDRTYEGLESAK